MHQPYAIRIKTLDSHEFMIMFIFTGCDVNIQSSSGRTPLLEAVINGDYDVAKLLIKAGCDPDITDTKGTGVLHQLCFTINPNLEIINLVIKSKFIWLHVVIICLSVCMYRYVCYHTLTLLLAANTSDFTKSFETCQSESSFFICFLLCSTNCCMKTCQSERIFVSQDWRTDDLRVVCT